MGQRNPRFKTATDGRLLDFKANLDDGVAKGIEDFRAMLGAIELPDSALVVIMPGHIARPSNIGTPLARAALALTAGDQRLTASVDSLIRHATVEKLATGGSRDVAVHLASIATNPPPTLTGRVVVLLDDTVSTGGSIMAARQLLGSAGASKIAALALGRTVKYL